MVSFPLPCLMTPEGNIKSPGCAGSAGTPWAPCSEAAITRLEEERARGILRPLFFSPGTLRGSAQRGVENHYSFKIDSISKSSIDYNILYFNDPQGYGVVNGVRNSFMCHQMFIHFALKIASCG